MDDNPPDQIGTHIPAISVNCVQVTYDQDNSLWRVVFADTNGTSTHIRSVLAVPDKVFANLSGARAQILELIEEHANGEAAAARGKFN